ncbi:odorant-binding protein-like [Muntiacus reevesi]|uniref:odorant-binding protein-like n=1 Tax=Muntiacus reevesi TaxID=9886 RepID=UPI0033077F9A
MKVLLFSLVLGLLVASQGEAQQDASQLTGRWKSHYMAANNIEKITEGGPFYLFMRYIEFDEENGTALFHFYLKENGECIEKYASGTKEEGFYASDYAGHTEFRVVRAENNALIADVINVDEHGKETQLVDLFGIGDDVGPKCKEVFYDTVREKGIPEENIVNFIDNDAGYTEFRVVRVENNALLADVFNVDEHGKETQLVQLFGIGDDVGPKCKEEFYNTVREKGIPEENILNFIDNDDCPEE